MTGTIKKIIRPKGFGFITPDDGSEEVFFHRGSMAPRNQIEDFNEGDTVQFQTRKGEKGPVAFDLQIRSRNFSYRLHPNCSESHSIVLIDTCVPVLCL
jgi:cold shock protein